MRTTSSIQFYCRKCKVDRNGYAPLECSLTISGQRKFLNLPIKFKPYGKRPPQEVIEAMDTWRNRITQYQIQMLKEGMVVTSETLREVIQQGGVKAYSIGRLTDDKLLLLRKRVGIDLKQSVYRKYELTSLKLFKYCHRDDDVSKLTPQLIQTILSDWRAKYDPATVCGYATRLKSFCLYGMNIGVITKNPFIGLRIQHPQKPIKSLTEDEVMNLLALNLEPRLNRILDLFLIQISTGMSYSDLMSFDIQNDLKKEGDYYYISKCRNKTGKVFTALVLPFGVPIILRYKSIFKISNQKYNKALKQINPTYTSHLGRRTYATILVNKGVDMGTVAAAIGDNVQIAAKYYARVLQSTTLSKQIEVFR